MQTVYAILFGIVQGLTEFLPISSSGHLVLLHDVLRVPAIDSLGFDVALHVGTALALIAYFFREFAVMLRMRDAASRAILRYIVIGTVPAAIVGYLYADVIEAALHTPLVVALALIVVGVILIGVDRPGASPAVGAALDSRRALAIGCAQALALIPGVSRSGATIVTGMAGGLTRADAARFSFMLSVPIVLAAAGKELLALPPAGIDWSLYAAGCAAAAVTGYCTLSYFLRFVASHRLSVFGWYRIALGAVVLLWVAVR